jgi:hypothetical protein
MPKLYSICNTMKKKSNYGICSRMGLIEVYKKYTFSVLAGR